MAKIMKQQMVITLTKLVRDSEDGTDVFVNFDDETIEKIETVMTKIVNDPSVIVEVVA
jgi:hypothetical protein